MVVLLKEDKIFLKGQWFFRALHHSTSPMIRFRLMQSSKLKSVGFFSPPFTFSVVVAAAAVKHPECSFMDMRAESLQSCPILCDTMNHSSPGSSVHGILQARILEWAAMSPSLLWT